MAEVETNAEHAPVDGLDGTGAYVTGPPQVPAGLPGRRGHVPEIARRAGLHPATASRLVAELVARGLLTREADRRVCVGVRMWELAVRASPALSLRNSAMLVMEDAHAVIRHHV